MRLDGVISVMMPSKARSSSREEYEEIDRLEQEGRIFVIRPERPVRVSRLERDLKKLQALHQEGRETAVKLLPALRSYLEI